MNNNFTNSVFSNREPDIVTSKSDEYYIIKSLPNSVLSLFYTTFYVNDIQIGDGTSIFGLSNPDNANEKDIGKKELLEELNKMLISTRPIVSTIKDSNYQSFMETEGLVGLESFTVEYENNYLVFPVANVNMKVVIPFNFLFNLAKYFYFINIGLVWDVSYGYSFNQNEIETLLGELYSNGIYEYGDILGNVKKISIDNLIKVIGNVMTTKRVKFVVYNVEISPSNMVVNITLKGFKLNDYWFANLRYPIIKNDIEEIVRHYKVNSDFLANDFTKNIILGNDVKDYSSIMAYINFSQEIFDTSYIKRRYKEANKKISDSISSIANKSYLLDDVMVVCDAAVGPEKIKVYRYSLLGILNDFIKNVSSVNTDVGWIIDLSNVNYKSNKLLQLYLGVCVEPITDIALYDKEYDEILSCVKKCFDTSRKRKGNYAVKSFASDYLRGIQEVIDKHYGKTNSSSRILPYFFIKEKEIKGKFYNVFEFVMYDSAKSFINELYKPITNKTVEAIREGSGTVEIPSLDQRIREVINKYLSESGSDTIFVDLLFDTKNIVIGDNISISVNADPNLRNILAEKAAKAVKARISIKGDVKVDYSNLDDDKSKKKNDNDIDSIMSFLPMEASLSFAFYNNFECGETIGLYYGPVFSHLWTIVSMSETIENSSNFFETTIRLVRK